MPAEEKQPSTVPPSQRSNYASETIQQPEKSDFQPFQNPVEKEEEKTPVLGSGMKSAEESLTGFPEFPTGTDSLLAKHLTREVWDQLKNEKDSAGYSFK